MVLRIAPRSHLRRGPVLMEMVDSHIASWVDENIASILEDALRSVKSGARDAKVKPRSQ